jgi:hypothetical protein
VGYGDITAKTDLGRVLAMATIISAIISVPQMTNELIEMLALQSIYVRARYIPKSAANQHILICGNIVSSSLREFFGELFHEDHDTKGLHCVILQPNTPTFEVLSIIRDSQFQLCITYLEGSPLNDKDLNRASASSAKAIFIMTNKFSTNPDEEDAKTILQQFSMQRFIRLYSTNVSFQPLFCMQLIRPENKRHLVTLEKKENLLSGSSSETDIVICLNEVKMGVIAKAVIFPVRKRNFFLLLFHF